MADSELVDFSSDDPRRSPGDRTRRRVPHPRPLTVVLLVALVGLPLLAAWVHLGRVHADDLDAFEALRADFVLVDDNAEPFLHGESPPCESSDDLGVLTRTYSPETGPTLRQLRDALRLVGYSSTTPSPGALVTMGRMVDGRRLRVDVRLDVAGEALGPDVRGFSLRATSPATSLACRLS